MMTDPVADMMTRIRNANANRSKTVSMPASTIKVGIAEILKQEGFIGDYMVEPQKPSSVLRLNLKYGEYGEQVIRKIERVSKPGRRVYSSSKELTPVLRGMGIQILSTPKGIVSDKTARMENLGGEILCKVY
jgi:small subunit ribosomal protein S8